MKFFKVVVAVLGTGVLPVLSSAQQQEKLWYTQPAVEWTEALPLGNGKIGAMVYGGVKQDRIQFNEETLWTGSPRNYNKSGAYKYLPQIRKLLAEGKQKEAEQLAQAEFMGLKSEAGNKQAWLDKVAVLRKDKKGPSAYQFNDSKWKSMYVPAYEGLETLGFEGLDGAFWFRTSFNLPKEWLGKNLVLDLNRVRNEDYTFVNGKLVGHLEGDEPKRRYVIPASVLKAGKNVVAVQVLNFIDKGGISGYKDTTEHIGIFPEGKTVKEGISLNGNWKYFIQDNEPPAPEVYQASYQPFGDLLLDFPHTSAAQNYKRELDLKTAIASTTYSVNGVNFSRSYFVSAPQNVLAIQLKADQKGNVSFNASLASPHTDYQLSTIDKNTIAIKVKVKHGALFGESHLTIQTSGGSLAIKNNKIEVKGANEATLYLTAATNFVNYQDVSGDPAKKCKETMAINKSLTYDAIRAAHLKDYQSLYNRFAINLGATKYDDIPTDQRIEQFAQHNDPAFAALYVQYGRYLLISSSRENSQPANLQGIWNHLLAPSWGSKYTTNINVEMNYWPAEMLNLSELHRPLFKMVSELAERGKETAKEYYNAQGWVLHHNTDIWRGTAPINNSNHGIWPTGSAWLSTHLWEHFLYTRDVNFLKDNYAILKNAVLFYNDFLVKDEKTGWLISTPSNSPENGGLVAGPAMDHQLIRALFHAFISASEILNTDLELSKTIAAKAKQIAPNQIGKHGQLQEWLEDKDDPENKHRHVSHLWGVHPGNEINWEQSEDLMKAARQSLIFRGDEGTGWSLAWKINFWARFKDGEHTLNMIKMLLRKADKGGGSYVNLFDAHPPFQIDGNFGGAAGIAEMLLQSHTSYIELLPALPPDFHTGEIKGIKARGAFELDFSWENNSLKSVRIKSLAGGKCHLKYKDKTFSFDTKKQENYILNGNFQLIK
jgi:alpha-L-fucosidase 2